MKRLLVFVCMFIATPGWAIDVSVGQHVRVRSSNPSGVPLHKEARPSMKGRVPNGSSASVIGFDNEMHWLKIDADGDIGWVVEKYVEEVLSGVEAALTASEQEWAVWGSGSDCEGVVWSGGRMTADDPSVLRVASWNIRWFPDGKMFGGSGTNLPWLACTIAWMNVDVVVLQEIRTTGAAADAWESVTDGLAAMTGAEWAIDLHECGSSLSQHVGFLWNTETVSLADMQDVWELNGAKVDDSGSTCTGGMRPGRYAHIASTQSGGADFDVFAVHLDSGTGQKDYDHRVAALERMKEAAERVASDEDVLVIGDFNTMGASGLTADQELSQTIETADDEGFVDMAISPECTEYFKGHGGWLDHIMVSKGMAEVSVSTSRVTGYCALANCQSMSEMPLAYQELSDHCPVILEITNEDLD